MTEQAQETQALQNVKNLKSIRDTLQEELNEDLPVGIQGLQDAKRVGSILSPSPFFLVFIIITGLRRREELPHNPV